MRVFTKWCNLMCFEENIIINAWSHPTYDNIILSNGMWWLHMALLHNDFIVWFDGEWYLVMMLIFPIWYWLFHADTQYGTSSLIMAFVIDDI